MYHIAVDQNLAEKAQVLLNEKGSSLTEAVNNFLQGFLLYPNDYFKDAELAAAYDRGKKQIQEGKCITFTWDEWERMEDGETGMPGRLCV